MQDISDMIAQQLQLAIQQGEDFNLLISFQQPIGTAMVITGFVFKAEIRKAPRAALVATFVTPIISYTNGQIQMSLTAAQTSLLTDSSYVYDLFGTAAGVTTKFFYGDITVIPKITQSDAEEVVV